MTASKKTMEVSLSKTGPFALAAHCGKEGGSEMGMIRGADPAAFNTQRLK